MIPLSRFRLRPGCIGFLNRAARLPRSVAVWFEQNWACFGKLFVGLFHAFYTIAYADIHIQPKHAEQDVVAYARTSVGIATGFACGSITDAGNAWLGGANFGQVFLMV